LAGDTASRRPDLNGRKRYLGRCDQSRLMSTERIRLYAVVDPADDAGLVRIT
jgi:hypothetical protein